MMKAVVASILAGFAVLFCAGPLYAIDYDDDASEDLKCAVASDEPVFPNGFFDGGAWRQPGYLSRTPVDLTGEGKPQNLWVVAPGAVKARDRHGVEYWSYRNEQPWAVFIEDTATGATTLLFERKLKRGMVKARVFDTGKGNHVRITMTNPEGSPNTCDVAYKAPRDFVMTEFTGFNDRLNEARYLNGKREGKLLEWTGIGVIESSFHDGKREGLRIEWYLGDGYPVMSSMGAYRDGKKEGVWAEWQADFMLRRLGVFEAGNREGLWTEWDWEGRLTEQTHYHEGKKHDASTKWRENGLKEEEGSYRNGERDGLWTQWFENGNKKQECHFSQGKTDGRCTVWYPDGTKRSEGVTPRKWCSPKEKGEGCRGTVSTRWYPSGTLEQVSARSKGSAITIDIDWYESGAVSEIGLEMPGMRQSGSWHKNGRPDYYRSWIAGGPETFEAWDEKGRRIKHWVTPDKKVREKAAAAERAKAINYWSDDSIQDGIRIGLSDPIDPRKRRKVVQGRFANGLKVGQHVGWFDTGQLAWVRHYENGQLNGREVEWHYFHGKRVRTREAFYRDGKLEGREREWYVNGRPKRIAFYRNGEPTSLVREWHENGRRELVGAYRNGKRNGRWTEWYVGGDSRMITYRDGLWHGRYTYKGVHLHEKCDYRQDERDGTCTQWNGKGVKVSVENYREGLLNGVSQTWTPDGRLNTSHFKDGWADGKKFSWEAYGFKGEHCFPLEKSGETERCLSVVRYPNLQVKETGVFLGDEADGRWQYWYENGQKRKEGAYLAGARSGLWKFYFEDGTVETEVVYVDGSRSGLWTDWYANGQMAWKGLITDDEIRDGPWAYWYANGEKRAEGAYEGMMRNGPWTMYYDNGQKRAEGTYVDDHREGPWRYWNPAGEPIDHMFDEDWQPEVN